MIDITISTYVVDDEEVYDKMKETLSGVLEHKTGK